MGIYEDRMYFLLKEGEELETNEDDSTDVGGNNVYNDPPNHEGTWSEPGPQTAGRQDPAVLSDAAVESHLDVRHGTLSRVLSNKEQASTADRALLAANLDVAKKEEYETSAPQLQKVSYPRSQTLSERVLSTIGRL